MLRLTFLFLCFTCPLFAQTGISPEAKYECERRGDAVEAVTGGVTAAADYGIFAAMQPPKDDSDKWFITLVTSEDCVQCERLKRDFAKAPELRPYVNVENYGNSWSHYNVVHSSDGTQKWRWLKYKPTRFPTVIIQPPVSGKFGKPETYLEPIEGYMMPAAMASTIRSRINRYVESLDARASYPEIQENPYYEQPTQSYKQTRREPPFQVLPQETTEDQTDTRPFFQDQPTMPDPITPIVLSLISLVPGGLTGIILIGVGAFYLIRERRKSQGKKLLVSDEQAAAIKEIVEQVIATKLVGQASRPLAS